MGEILLMNKSSRAHLDAAWSLYAERMLATQAKSPFRQCLSKSEWDMLFESNNTVGVASLHGGEVAAFGIVSKDAREVPWLSSEFFTDDARQTWYLVGIVATKDAPGMAAFKVLDQIIGLFLESYDLGNACAFTYDYSQSNHELYEKLGRYLAKRQDATAVCLDDLRFVACGYHKK